MFILNEYVIYSKISRKLQRNWQGGSREGFVRTLFDISFADF